MTETTARNVDSGMALRSEKVTAATPLPKGWGSFCSTPDSRHRSHWYATAPWDVFALKEEYGPEAQYLTQMVDAPTWTELHKQVAAQVTIRESLGRGDDC
ncbi:hypothetical protein ACFZDI_18705 [Streptomyces sp. NPDC007907]|uniref:hypothetical protein n=1 Tax=Streptomyces sp. NPDC007907 TaxID=3364789 RepID=UPI0036ED2628